MFVRSDDFKLSKEQTEKCLALDGVHFFEKREEPQGNELKEWVQRKIARAKAIEQLGSVVNLENKQFEGEVAHNFMRHIREIATFDLHCNEPFHMGNKKNQAWTAIETSLNAKCKVIRFITLRNSREVSMVFKLENSVTMSVESGLKFVNMKKFEDDVRQFFLGPFHLYDFITKTIWAHIDEYAAIPREEKPVEKSEEVHSGAANKTPSVENRSNSGSHRGGREQQRGRQPTRGQDRHYPSNSGRHRPENNHFKGSSQDIRKAENLQKPPVGRQENNNFKSSSQDIRKAENAGKAENNPKEASEYTQTPKVAENLPKPPVGQQIFNNSSQDVRKAENSGKAENIPKPSVEASESTPAPQVAENLQKHPSESTQTPKVAENLQENNNFKSSSQDVRKSSVEASESIPTSQVAENAGKAAQIEVPDAAQVKTSEKAPQVETPADVNQNKENNRKVGGSFGAKKPDLTPSVATLMSSFEESS
ncbi:unnamed protein product [Caenorhabditis angaria]|uniref:Uncharacterized protein n=1 Tax=Caenorhabditis angaria TaxID=860376 RepID=A0A9P1N082_9PELO|nr:unnamed protein product [Caenorhabditis angaria]